MKTDILSRPTSRFEFLADGGKFPRYSYSRYVAVPSLAAQDHGRKQALGDAAWERLGITNASMNRVTSGLETFSSIDEHICSQHAQTALTRLECGIR